MRTRATLLGVVHSLVPQLGGRQILIVYSQELELAVLFLRLEKILMIM